MSAQLLAMRRLCIVVLALLVPGGMALGDRCTGTCGDGSTFDRPASSCDACRMMVCPRTCKLDGVTSCKWCGVDTAENDQSAGGSVTIVLGDDPFNPKAPRDTVPLEGIARQRPGTVSELGDGRVQIQIEIIQLQLTGNSPIIGPVDMQFVPPPGVGALTDQAPGQPSLFPADSFIGFDFFQINLNAPGFPPFVVKPSFLQTKIPDTHPIAGDNTGPATVVWRQTDEFDLPVFDQGFTVVAWILDLEVGITFDNDPEIPGECESDADCDDADVCTCDECQPSGCVFSAVLLYGDVFPEPCGNGAIDVDDILCVLRGFANFADCPGGDMFPQCTGNGVIDVDDILAALGAFGGAGAPACGC